MFGSIILPSVRGPEAVEQPQISLALTAEQVAKIVGDGSLKKALLSDLRVPSPSTDLTPISKN